MRLTEDRFSKSCARTSVHQRRSKVLVSCRPALTVRLLTRRFIGEYGDIRKCPLLLSSVFNFQASVLTLRKLFCRAESIYSHSFTVDGREITLNIWDLPYSEVEYDISPSASCYLDLKQLILRWTQLLSLMFRFEISPQAVRYFSNYLIKSTCEGLCHIFSHFHVFKVVHLDVAAHF